MEKEAELFGNVEGELPGNVEGELPGTGKEIKTGECVRLYGDCTGMWGDRSGMRDQYE